jgi:hypothetical protein
MRDVIVFRPRLPKNQDQQFALPLCASVQQGPIRSCSSQKAFIRQWPMLPHSRTQGPGLRAFNHGVEAVSGALPHREQQASMSILLICLFFLVGRICLLSFHANIQIFGGTASDQRPFHSARSPARAELDALACALF